MFETVITWLDWVTIVFAFVTMIGVLYNGVKQRKQLDRIWIVFIIKSTNKEILIDNNLTRKDCQRSEIQGILRTKLPKGINIYDIDYLKEDRYFKNIYDIQIAKTDKLVIYLEDDELEQFGF